LTTDKQSFKGSLRKVVYPKPTAQSPSFLAGLFYGIEMLQHLNKKIQYEKNDDVAIRVYHLCTAHRTKNKNHCSAATPSKRNKGGAPVTPRTT
jgi:hypothetical protein